jgi:hypothetical protein
MFVIPSADALVSYIRDFTGSTNDNEIKQCIFLAEMSMRNIELPALRSDPYAPENIGLVNSQGQVPIPGDMNKPILFFKQGQQYITTATSKGISGGTRLTLLTTPSRTLTAGMLVNGIGIGANATIQSTSGQITGTGSGSSASYTFTLSAPNGQVVAGMTVTGNGIAPGATVTNVVGSTITISTPTVGSVSGVITFTAVAPTQIIVLTVPCSSVVNGTVTFTTPAPASGQSQTGPWIVYDRIGDRDIITQSMIAQLYLQPVNVPAVIRGKFSEVGNNYKFLPYTAEGDLINMYYYKAWPLLFSPLSDTVISTTGTVGSITGTGPWTAHITGMSSTVGLVAGDQITALAGTGRIGTGGTYIVSSVVSPTEIIFTATGGTTPTAGTVTNVAITNQTVQENAVLNTWPEGYVYATLREYYIKRHNQVDAQIYEQKFQLAWDTVEDQNNLGKWSGGHTRLTSVWQPRQYRQYNIK